MAELSGREVAEWEAYYLSEPFGEYQKFWRTGILCSLVSNMMKKKEKKAAKPEDFIPSTYKHPVDGEDEKQSLENIKVAVVANFSHKGKGFTKRDYLRARKRKKIKKKGVK